jgi:hypothetical protein
VVDPNQPLGSHESSISSILLVENVFVAPRAVPSLRHAEGRLKSAAAVAGSIYVCAVSVLRFNVWILTLAVTW